MADLPGVGTFSVLDPSAALASLEPVRRIGTRSNTASGKPPAPDPFYEQTDQCVCKGIHR